MTDEAEQHGDTDRQDEADRQGQSKRQGEAERERLRRTFDGVAGSYQAARPEYPAAL